MGHLQVLYSALAGEQHDVKRQKNVPFRTILCMQFIFCQQMEHTATFLNT